MKKAIFILLIGLSYICLNADCKYTVKQQYNKTTNWVSLNMHKQDTIIKQTKTLEFLKLLEPDISATIGMETCY